MGVKIRMTRTGAKNSASFRIVAADSRAPRDGRHIEILGWYDPKRAGTNFELKQDRIAYWTTQGAELSDTVRNLVRRAAKAQAAS
jgi:small subunit ribosomal protein S16